MSNKKAQLSQGLCATAPPNEPEIAPFDPPTPKTLAKSQICSGSDAPFAGCSPLNYNVTLKLGFGVTQDYRK